MQQGYPSGRGVGGPWRPVLTTGQHAGRLLGGSGKAPQDESIIGVEVDISPDKRLKLADLVSGFLMLQFLDRATLKEVAGLVSWVASVVPAMKPFCAVLWAAATAKPAGTKRPRKSTGNDVV